MLHLGALLPVVYGYRRRVAGGDARCHLLACVTDLRTLQLSEEWVALLPRPSSTLLRAAMVLLLSLLLLRLMLLHSLVLLHVNLLLRGHRLLGCARCGDAQSRCQKLGPTCILTKISLFWAKSVSHS